MLEYLLKYKRRCKRLSFGMYLCAVWITLAGVTIAKNSTSPFLSGACGRDWDAPRCFTIECWTVIAVPAHISCWGLTGILPSLPCLSFYFHGRASSEPYFPCRLLNPFTSWTLWSKVNFTGPLPFLVGLIYLPSIKPSNTPL